MKIEKLRPCCVLGLRLLAVILASRQGAPLKREAPSTLLLLPLNHLRHIGRHFCQVTLSDASLVSLLVRSSLPLPACLTSCFGQQQQQQQRQRNCCINKSIIDARLQTKQQQQQQSEAHNTRRLAYVASIQP